MPLTYSLKYCTKQSVTDVLNFLSHSTCELRPSDVAGKLEGPGVIVSASNMSELGKTIMKDSYGIDPTIRVNFNVDKFDDFEVGLRITIKAVLKLFESTDSDGILMFNNDIPILLQKNGRLVVDPGPGFWPELPAMLDRGFEFEDLPVPR